MLEEKQKNWGVGAIGAINEAGPGLFRLHLQIGLIISIFSNFSRTNIAEQFKFGYFRSE